MVWSNTNVVTLMIAIIICIFIVKGIVNEFSADRISNSIIGFINNILFLASLFVSIYISRKVIVEKGSGKVWSEIYGFIPETMKSFFSDAGILIYLIVTPVILIAVYFLLVYIRSFMDNPIDKLSYRISRALGRTNRVVRTFIGIIIEIPRAFIMTMAFVIILSMLSIYYPDTKLAAYSDDSRLYNTIYSHTVSPLINSDFGQKVPVFVQNSLTEMYKEIGNSKILGESEKLRSLGYLRFQYESRSNEQIDNMAKKIVGTETDDRKKAYLLYKWIGNNVDYDWEKYNNIVNNKSENDKFGAVVAFNTRKGICEDYSDLYVAMARAVGLKVRIIVGQGYSMGAWGGHAWNEVYISKENRWISVDTTWAKSGNYFDNKDFNKTHVFEDVAGEW